MRRGILVLAVLLAFGAIAASAIAVGVIPEPPFETNSECLACHDAADPGATSTVVDFAVLGEVEYDRCKTCHAGLPVSGLSEPDHFHRWEPWFSYPLRCGSGCHDVIDEPIFLVPDGVVIGQLVPTAYGLFASAASLDASPETLHAVHMNPSWVEDTFGDLLGNKCSRCHASAACSSCHSGAVPHGDHALPDYPAVTYKQATGSAAVVAESSCVNEYCHAISAAGAEAFNEPACVECHSHELADMAVAHVPPADEAFCLGCHAGGADTIHVNAAIDGTPYTSCYVCHRVDLGPATAQCAECHGTFGEHTYSAGVHLASGEGCLNCHSADLVVEHANLTPSSCEACHTHEWFPADGWDNTCKSCHAGPSHQHGGTGGGGGRR